MNIKISPLKKFGIWMGIIFIMVVVAAIKDNKESHFFDDLREQARSEKEEKNTTEDTNNDKFVEYEEMINKLKENNYDYVFTINNGNKYTYTGTRCNGLETGFKESVDEVIKYIIGYDKKTYKVVNDEYIDIDNLYDGFDSNYLIIDKIFNDLSEIVYELNMKEDEAVYNYNLDNYKVVITTTKENIKSINITFEDISYNLEFSNIGKCVKIDFNI